MWRRISVPQAAKDSPAQCPLLNQVPWKPLQPVAPAPPPHWYSSCPTLCRNISLPRALTQQLCLGHENSRCLEIKIVFSCCTLLILYFWAVAHLLKYGVGQQGSSLYTLKEHQPPQKGPVIEWVLSADNTESLTPVSWA